jgi:hypothetical protein
VVPWMSPSQAFASFWWHAPHVVPWLRTFTRERSSWGGSVRCGAWHPAHETESAWGSVAGRAASKWHLVHAFCVARAPAAVSMDALVRTSWTPWQSSQRAP